MITSAEPMEQDVCDLYESLYRFAITLTQAESDARDLTQHTFWIWAEKHHQLRDASKAKAWLFTTLHRAFLKTRSRQIRFPHFHLEEMIHELEVENPTEAMATDVTQLMAALAQVDKIYRAAVALRFLEDRSYREIAGMLDIPVGTVKSRIARGIRQLRSILMRDDSIPPQKSEGALYRRNPDASTRRKSGSQDRAGSPIYFEEPSKSP